MTPPPVPLSASADFTTILQTRTMIDSPFQSEVDSPEIRPKRKLAYYEDPIFHVSDCDTPLKDDISICESVEEIESEEAIPYPLNLVKVKKFIFESSLDQLLYQMRCPDPDCISKIKD